MTSDAPEKWREKMDITYEEYFKPSYSIPHPGIVGLVREMEREIGREEAHRILAQTAERLTVEGIRRAVEKEPVNSFRDFVEGRKRRGPISTHGTSEETVEETDERLVFNMTECLWAKTWRELGAPDIGYLWNCRPDFALVRAMHPSLRPRQAIPFSNQKALLSRTETPPFADRGALVRMRHGPSVSPGSQGIKEMSSITGVFEAHNRGSTAG